MLSSEEVLVQNLLLTYSSSCEGTRQEGEVEVSPEDLAELEAWLIMGLSDSCLDGLAGTHASSHIVLCECRRMAKYNLRRCAQAKLSQRLLLGGVRSWPSGVSGG